MPESRVNTGTILQTELKRGLATAPHYLYLGLSVGRSRLSYARIRSRVRPNPRAGSPELDRAAEFLRGVGGSFYLFVFKSFDLRENTINGPEDKNLAQNCPVLFNPQWLMTKIGDPRFRRNSGLNLQ